MEFKFAFALISTAITIAAYVPYLKDVFARRTKPHAYTWLIWAITQGTVTAVIWYEGGNWGALSLLIGTILVVVVFILSFQYGTRNITRSDTVVLVLALLAVAVWWRLDNPLLAVLMVTSIDAFGYIPTIRKSFYEPWSETVSSWALFTLAAFFAILALEEYSVPTVLYLCMLMCANCIVIALCLIRRRNIARPAGV